MYFGEFLIKENLITVDQLVDSMIKHFESGHSLLRSLVSLNILSPEKIIDVLSYAHSHSKSFSQALKDGNFLNEEELLKIENHNKDSKKTLGFFLIDSGYITQEEYNSALSKYAEISNTQQPSPCQPDLSDAALESMKELGLDTSSIDNSEEKKNDETNEEVELSSAALESMKELGLDTSSISSQNVDDDWGQSASHLFENPAEETEDESQLIFHEGLNDNVLLKFSEWLGEKSEDINKSEEFFNGFIVELCEWLNKVSISIQKSGYIVIDKFFQTILKQYSGISFDLFDHNFDLVASNLKSVNDVCSQYVHLSNSGINEKEMMNNIDFKKLYMDTIRNGLSLLKLKEN